MKSTHRIVVLVEAYDLDDAVRVLHSGDVDKMSIVKVEDIRKENDAKTNESEGEKNGQS